MSFPTARLLRLWLPCLAMTVAGCATAGGRQPAADVDWRLVELDGTPVAPSAGRREPYLRLLSEGERVTGFTTCNNLFGRYEVRSRGRLRFVTLGSTKMACVDPVLARQEQQFMGALQAVDRFTVSRDRLILFEGRRSRARFVPAQPR
jgi:heat shock protein HslJ